MQDRSAHLGILLQMISDASALDFLKDSNSLLDSRLMGVLIGEEPSGAVNVELKFRALVPDPYEIRIKLTEVIEYEISYEEKDGYPDIWDLKILKLEDDSFYVALDPDPSIQAAAAVTHTQASDDHLFVRSRHIEAFVIPGGGRTTVHGP